MPFAYSPSLSADEEHRVLLASDPLVQSTNDVDSIRHYLLTGDQSRLEVPAGADHVVLRALTYAETEAARERAGRIPVLGHKLHQSADLELDAAGRAAVAAYEAWTSRYATALALASVVRMDPPWKDARGQVIEGPALEQAFDTIRPVSARTAFMAELGQHARRVGETPPQGKA